jgi:hypothetical protein
METIQYSLNKNSTYSIDLNSSIYTSSKIYTPSKIQLHKTKTSTKLNNIFDKHCLETYGNKTCILFELDDGTIEIRLLDNKPNTYTRKNKLYIVIPSLLEKLYTVVLVQMIQKTNAKEIVAIHFPSN